MPTYEYKCKRCNYRFEEFQSILAEPLKVCPRCQGQLERLISAGAGVIFKGNGFYITDYKKKSDGNGNKKPLTQKETSKSEPAVSTSESKKE
jgi:putative FmdB family regulatory protein